MGKQITRIRLLQRPGPVKDGSRRSRQRWELYVYVHTLTVMTHTQVEVVCELHPAEVWVCLTGFEFDWDRRSGACGRRWICVFRGTVWGITSGLHVEAPTSQDLTSSHLLDVWACRPAKADDRTQAVFVCFSHPHLWALESNQSSTKDVCLSLKPAMHLSCRQTSLGSSFPPKLKDWLQFWRTRRTSPWKSP